MIDNIIDKKEIIEKGRTEFAELCQKRDAGFEKLDREIKKTSKMNTESFIGTMKNQPLLGLETLVSNYAINKDTAPFLKEGKIDTMEDLGKVLRVIEKTVPEQQYLWANDSRFYDILFNNLNRLIDKGSQQYSQSQGGNHHLLDVGTIVNIFESKEISDFFLASKAFCYVSALRYKTDFMDNLNPHFLTDYSGVFPSVNLIESFAYSANGPDVFKDITLPGTSVENYSKTELKYAMDTTIENLNTIKETYNLNEFEYVSFVGNLLAGTNAEGIFRNISTPDIFGRIMKIPEIEKNKPLFDRVLWGAFKKVECKAKYSDDTMLIRTEYMKSVAPALVENRLFLALNGLLYGMGLNNFSSLEKEDAVRFQLKGDADDNTLLFETMKDNCEIMPKFDFNKDLDVAASILNRWLIGMNREEIKKYYPENANTNPFESERKFYDYTRMQAQEKKEIREGCTAEEKTIMGENIKKLSNKYIIPFSIFTHPSIGSIDAELCAAFPLNAGEIWAPADISGDSKQSLEFIERYLEAGGSMEILDLFQENPEKYFFNL